MAGYCCAAPAVRGRIPLRPHAAFARCLAQVQPQQPGRRRLRKVATNLPHTVPVRDTKHPHGRTLDFTTHSWTAFLHTLRSR
ncbi:DUF397 domain-containing protein [Streptomyces sp. NPDC005438]|uniref:DUF397 domain-containing protein n=1 Tax=Streptomyces sp. NPDC005438 TaxID=3156880 RepID=UPI0033B3FF42